MEVSDSEEYLSLTESENIQDVSEDTDLEEIVSSSVAEPDSKERPARPLIFWILRVFFWEILMDNCY